MLKAILATFLLVMITACNSNSIVNDNKESITGPKKEEQQTNNNRKSEEEKESQLIDFMGECSDNFTKSIHGIDEQYDLYDADNSIINNEDWKEETQKNIDLINKTADNVLNYDVKQVPLKYKDSFQYYTLAAKDYIKAMDYIKENMEGNSTPDIFFKIGGFLMSASDNVLKSKEALPDEDRDKFIL